jgi:transposase
MLLHPMNLTILLCSAPTDMRKSIDGLCLLVDGDLDQNPTCGTIYVFCNRRRDKLKLLYWDGNGFCLLYKHLEKSCFNVPTHGSSMVITPDALHWLLQGIDFRKLPKPKLISFQSFA